MKTWSSSALFSTLQGALYPSAKRFRAALCRPELAQEECLRRVLGAVAGTQQAARIPAFPRIRTARDFQSAVPFSTPDSLRAPLEAAARGAARVLTHAPVRRFELTGGSSGASKYVPMTAGLLDEFHRALAPLLHDLLSQRPALKRGPSYWSISPLGSRAERTEGGVAIGSVEDSAYFPRPLQPLLRRMFAVPGEVARLPDVASCRYVTLWHLVASEDLTLLSVWNPSFLTLLLDALEEHGERLAEDLERGTCRPPSSGPIRGLPAHPHRAAALRAVLDQGLQARTLWPQLALVSMWTDAEAGRAVGPAMRRLKGVELQGKGLLATEGVVTLPLFDAPAPVLAVRSHFYEFADPERPGARPLLAHELEAGRTYEVLLSTSGGLLRYRLGDLVRVEGFAERTPCLRFLGRADAVSDLVGEKLSAARAAEVLTQVLSGSSAHAFSMLAPEWTEPPPGYRLFLESSASDDELSRVAQAVEKALKEGVHYRYARDLGQLRPVTAWRVRDGLRRYEARCLALGQRAGDIKPVLLHRAPGWTEHFGEG